MTLRDRKNRPGPKKILALDGGGILGLISIEVLERIEALLREREGRPDLVLADYFDLCAGTSTGAVISTLVSLGMSVDTIRSFYIECGPAMFDRASLLERLNYEYESEPLARKLQSVIGPDREGEAADALATLGTERLRTLLMVVTRNATTDSPWPITNNPDAKYNDRARSDCNLELPLWKVVRASTAAPSYFPPEVVDIGPRRFVFVDGGVTTYNNPAFLAFVTATTGPYHINWKAGERDMLVVSVGTGDYAREQPDLSPSQMNLLYIAKNTPGALMNAASAGQDMLCRVFGKCLSGNPIDREIGDLIGAGGPTGEKLFTYMRYDADVSRKGLDALGLPDVNPAHVQLLDSVRYIDEIQRVGKAVAAKCVKAEDFAGF
ncbi:MAG TPA: patatin-like phospholipase family protein [Rhodocyclaceae bacterium]|nr:patatin-like phospholipase family protein [Rhodocyclaceae bacterium]HMV54059.1 patatin-like phospholipase family protein [Rhodocyclaceae bacterium]HMZ84999.1 patatin-like phospholipase family protein [Rhodocyclaceae bacterium]HNA03041.1 patatin-like phospholipase family protein [Rhodocyclaceae bacterium]HNB77845.1 patatin-like phospholipase family protein [Rhodocyclaceae bacterium]